MTALPTPGQLAWQSDGFGLFLHFGINTFYGREWSDGTLDPAASDPGALDARDCISRRGAATPRATPMRPRTMTSIDDS